MARSDRKRHRNKHFRVLLTSLMFARVGTVYGCLAAALVGLDATFRQAPSLCLSSTSCVGRRVERGDYLEHVLLAELVGQKAVGTRPTTAIRIRVLGTAGLASIGRQLPCILFPGKRVRQASWPISFQSVLGQQNSSPGSG